MTLYTQLCICVLCSILGLSTSMELYLDKLCPVQPSPPQDIGLFRAYDIDGPKRECGNATLYILHTHFGQSLIEKPSPWVTKLVNYLSGRNHPVFQKFTKVAATPTQIINITEEEKTTFSTHMISKNSKLLLYKVKDGPETHICQMRVTTWATTSRGYITFQAKIDLSSATRKFNNICVRPNLLAGEETPEVTTKPPRK
ncbi:envelope glycoprotein UL130 [Cercopithecine betaherpesvirus 5]|uniref:Envelope glycoprotein UL130 n=1 Tax=Simian cytomegalovirus (strain Colburn) TaxID=50292 RepID=G8XTI0_SCMVC|nr:envelope glycoprotein UL130 [Cercopithecine betaherpesvirus 5]AEV80472.1 envelope glycoprotein UL130 [Cercopithecine betaherpesvirus 5]